MASSLFWFEVTSKSPVESSFLYVLKSVRGATQVRPWASIPALLCFRQSPFTALFHQGSFILWDTWKTKWLAWPYHTAWSFSASCPHLNGFIHEKHGSPSFKSYLIDQLFNALSSPASSSPTQKSLPFSKNVNVLLYHLYSVYCDPHFSNLPSAILTSLISVSPGAPSTVCFMQWELDICWINRLHPFQSK